MFDIQLSVSGVIFGASTAIFLVMIILLLVDVTSGDFRIHDNYGCVIAAIITFFITIISLFFVVKYYKLSTSPEVIHEELLNDLDKAEKELQKFYIDHPEFKE
jgi:hypothetical protein